MFGFALPRLNRRFYRTFFAIPVLSYSFYYNCEDKKCHARSIIRGYRVFGAASRIAALYFFNVPADEDYEKWSKLHSKSANILLKLFQKNSGVFIKLGQHLAALDYLIPIEYCNSMSIMFNQAPLSPIEDVKWVIKNELKHSADEIFVQFDNNPIGSASLAQVHVATLKKTGEKVAVKVQHKFLEKIAKTDISVAIFAFGCIKWIFPQFEFDWLAEEMRYNLEKEMNFEEEAQNAQKCHEMFKEQQESVVVPKIFSHLSTKKVLVMEYLDNSFMITDVEKLREQKVDPYEVISRVGEVFCKMLFVEKFLHCDPHPGNLLIVPENGTDFSKWRLGIIDHGLYFQISEKTASSYANLWISIFAMNENQILRWCQTMGITGRDSRVLSCMISQNSWSFLAEKKLLDASLAATLQTEALKKAASANLTQIIKILSRLPRELLLMMKSNELLRNAERKLTNSFSSNVYLRHILEYSFRNSFRQLTSIFTREAIELFCLYLKFKFVSFFG